MAVCQLNLISIHCPDVTEKTLGVLVTHLAHSNDSGQTGQKRLFCAHTDFVVILIYLNAKEMQPLLEC